MKQRLQKILSVSGVASRRAAERLILSGRVRVNGVPARLGDSADVETDKITVDGKSLPYAGPRIYIMLNKPRGYVTTLCDEKGRSTVLDLVRTAGGRVFPVGRLDMDSEGLLILTNDGEFANKLAHPSHGAKKTYHVWVENGKAGKSEGIAEAVSLLRGKMVMDGRPLSPAKADILRSEDEQAVLAITISEGRNRQVRRMCGMVGLRVNRLVRVAQGELLLGRLKLGDWRYLSAKEIDYLRGII